MHRTALPTAPSSPSARHGGRTARRMLAGLTVAACALIAGCSDDANDNDNQPGNTSLGTIDDPEINEEAPGVSNSINDVTDGAGEGGDPGRTDGAPTGTVEP